MELTCKEGIAQNSIVLKNELKILTLLQLRRGQSYLKIWRENKRKANSMISAQNLPPSNMTLA